MTSVLMRSLVKTVDATATISKSEKAMVGGYEIDEKGKEMRDSEGSCNMGRPMIGGNEI